MNNTIPVIDLFAGPGGLGEGFSSLMEGGKPVFDIKLSIEKEENAHKTLTLRSFYRHFKKAGKKIPNEYYDLLHEKDLKEREKKFAKLFETYKNEGNKAKEEAQLIELGKVKSEIVDKKIRNALSNIKEWVLIGGPPCQAYSLAGRSRVGGINEEDARVYLYREYLRIIAFHHPAVFVMENVKGLLSAKVGDQKVFHWILNDLRDPSKLFPGKESPKYKLYSLVTDNVKKDKDFLIKAENYGIPQKRHRVILLGIREDINSKPGFLQKRKEVTLDSVIGGLPEIRSRLNRKFIGNEIVKGKKKRKYKRVLDSDREWYNLIQEFLNEIKTWNGFSEIDENQFILNEINSFGSEFISCEKTINRNHSLYHWYIDKRLKGVINHESRSHLIDDLKRYIFLAIYTKLYNNFPRLKDYKRYSKSLLPEHESANSGKFTDRFRVQLPNNAATTITSHISKDGHYYIHYDYKQMRSLTVREAARIQTFPDNYLFCGSRTKQFHQVGNAVPPFLAYQIADIVSGIV
ncbi:MAG: DNA (cytosine-5-)-methyltransferase [Bacteroidota bacterium]|nr:DNA (cytosine-5-)-methyltransferase [Bacteroidota bacterium]